MVGLARGIIGQGLIALNASDPVNRELARQMYVTHQLSSPDKTARDQVYLFMDQLAHQ